MLPQFVGEWHLDGYAFVNTSVGTGAIPSPSDIEEWLLVTAGAGWPEFEAQSGLVLTVRGDGTYSERVSGAPPMLWYDTEGVQTDSPEPTEGVVRDVHGQSALSLHPGTARAHEGNSQGNLRGVVRYDDGDTVVSDLLRVQDGILVRAISVVTDELYFNRVVARYRRT